MALAFVSGNVMGSVTTRKGTNHLMPHRNFTGLIEEVKILTRALRVSKKSKAYCRFESVILKKRSPIKEKTKKSLKILMYKVPVGENLERL